MRKIKMVIASFLGVIAVVMAFAVGARVNAATSHTATYEWRAGDGNGSSGSRFYFGGGSLTTNTFSPAQSIDGITFSSHDVTNSASRTVTITLTETEWSYNVVTAYVYLYTPDKNRTITIGGVDKGKTTASGLQYFSGTLTSSAKTVNIGGNGVDWCGIDLVLTPTVTTYTVSFNSMGGSGVTSQTVAEGGKATKPSPNPTYDGHAFVDWYTSENEGATLSNTAFDFENTSINGALTLYAKWAETYTVSFNSKGGSAVSSQTVVEGGKATKPTPNPTKTGYALVDWYTSPDGGNTLSATAFDFANTNINEDITLYAKWEVAATYTVRFKKYSDDVEVYDIVSDITEGESIGAEDWPKDPKILNKTFNGWYDGETKYTSSTEITANKTLVAKFTDLDNDLIKFKDYYSGLPTSNADPHIASYNITDDSKVQVQEINKRNTGSPTFDDGTTFGGFIQCQKVVFTLDEAALVSIYALQTGDKKSRTTKLYKGEEEIESFVFGYSDKTTIKYFLGAGTYTVSIYENNDGSGTLANYYGIRVNKDYSAKGVTASVYAEKNTTLNTLRFVGTITGISDLTEIDTIELVLLKDDKPTKKQIFFDTVFTAVTGTSQDCSAAEGTYYVVYRITSASTLSGSTISKKLIVTFKDGSQATCDATTIDI